MRIFLSQTNHAIFQRPVATLGRLGNSSRAGLLVVGCHAGRQNIPQNYYSRVIASILRTNTLAFTMNHALAEIDDHQLGTRRKLRVPSFLPSFHTNFLDQLDCFFTSYLTSHLSHNRKDIQKSENGSLFLHLSDHIRYYLPTPCGPNASRLRTRYTYQHHPHSSRVFPRTSSCLLHHRRLLLPSRPAQTGTLHST